MNKLMIVLIILLIIITIKYISYRRQIKSICRQLSFISNNVTNQRIRIEESEKEVVEIAQLINEINEKHSKREIEIQNKDKRLKEMLTSVSHDIRTPLTSLKGYFTLLMSENDVKKQMKYAKVMNERMDDLSELLEELFTYTKLQNEDYRFELTKVNVTKLVLDTLFTFYEPMKEKGINPDLEIDEKSYYVMCNDVAVKRVISNIIRNAILHGDREIKMQYGSQDNNVYFLCQNKVNNPESIDVEQIFNRFYIADKARSTNSTGLGLAIAKELVEHMDGTISAEIEKDVFRIKIEFNII